ncbi:MAG: multidrug effflux MFS transporter [Acidimicrobiia bacterium]|nr:multidrug effflux MFS transporter [Acidimicrobiia bacterium]NNF87362.1 multidrug effflux MFS transporter [Acidimicrobiia bacterium]NNL12169.1 multidrug effflux MFS transporter [Acidimicrobiia bacterium]NNL96720.1 multidrug effflux MFS transporter [Acidimicrobiia bacterium]RZV47809.1 MAG: Bcr/CflA family efflux MFS transporter [Acidimicrobiia bacterium]
MLALTMALGALGIDLMLPAFDEMRSAFDLAADSTRVAGIVTTYMLGLAVGTLLYGPMSDRTGRRPALYLGFLLYGVGALGAALAPSLSMILVARFLWGVGAAGPRTMVLSIIRDSYSGDEMAKRMSTVFGIFILVPVFAPALGAVIVAVAPWRWVFWVCVAYVGAIALWVMRLPETLDPADRIESRPSDVINAVRTVLGNRQTVGYMLALTVSFGAFVSYLASSELILSDVFDRAELFPVFFGALASVMGAAMLSNSRIVDRFGVRATVRRALFAYVAAAGALTAVAALTDGAPPLWLFSLLLAVVLTMHALLIPNANALAMDPMGSVAGTAASVIGFISTGGGAGLGAIIDQSFNGTVVPLAIGFLLSAVLSLALATWAETGRHAPRTVMPDPGSPEVLG